MDTENVREILGRISGMCERLAEELDKPKIEEGQYWRYKDDVIRITDVDQPFCSYHSITDSRWKANIGKCNVRVLHDTAVHLSEETVEEILIEEADKRGLLEDGVELRWNHSKHSTTVAGGFDNVHYESYTDYLVAEDQAGTFLYQEGNWPEIIEDEWEVKSYSNVKGYFIKGNDESIYGKTISEEQAEAIAEALNNMED